MVLHKDVELLNITSILNLNNGSSIIELETLSSALNLMESQTKSLDHVLEEVLMTYSDLMNLTNQREYVKDFVLRYSDLTKPYNKELNVDNMINAEIIIIMQNWSQELYSYVKNRNLTNLDFINKLVILYTRAFRQVITNPVKEYYEQTLPAINNIYTLIRERVEIDEKDEKELQKLLKNVSFDENGKLIQT